MNLFTVASVLLGTSGLVAIVHLVREVARHSGWLWAAWAASLIAGCVLFVVACFQALVRLP